MKKSYLLVCVALAYTVILDPFVPYFIIFFSCSESSPLFSWRIMKRIWGAQVPQLHIDWNTKHQFNKTWVQTASHHVYVCHLNCMDGWHFSKICTRKWNPIYVSTHCMHFSASHSTYLQVSVNLTSSVQDVTRLQQTSFSEDSMTCHRCKY